MCIRDRSCAYPFLNFDEPLSEAYQAMGFAPGKGNLTRGTVCGRGQATQDVYAQPDRITAPLKRAGKRGEGKWKPIGWDQLLKEAVSYTHLRTARSWASRSFMTRRRR